MSTTKLSGRKRRKKKSLPKRALAGDTVVVTAIVTASKLNVRPEPSTQKPPIGELKKGDRVRILARDRSWYRIEVGTIEGYVYGDYLTIVDGNLASGFLSGREDLKTSGLEPARKELISIKPDFSAREKLEARTWNSQGGLLLRLSNLIEIDVAAAVAVLCVESGGKGFNSDGRMIIRFENHIFWNEWGKHNPNVYGEHFRFNPEKRWLNHEFRLGAAESWASFHGDQAKEWVVFEFARTCDEPASMRSISMGGPQIMGFNHPRIGYDSVREMFSAFQSDIRYQILGLFDFLKGPGTISPMVIALQRKKFADFASLYNGPGQAAQYGSLIEGHFETFNKLRLIS